MGLDLTHSYKISTHMILKFGFWSNSTCKTGLYGEACLPRINTFSSHITSNVGLLTKLLIVDWMELLGSWDY